MKLLISDNFIALLDGRLSAAIVIIVIVAHGGAEGGYLGFVLVLSASDTNSQPSEIKHSGGRINRARVRIPCC